MSLLKRLEKEKEIISSRGEKPYSESRNIIGLPQILDPWRDLKVKIHQETIKNLKTDKLEFDEVKTITERVMEEYIESNSLTLPRIEKQRIIQEVIDEILGFGPITSLLNDDNISEVMVNGPKQVYIERQGKIELTNITFYDDNHVLHIIEKIVAPIGRRIDESQPMVDARLPDGSRVNAVIPPLSLNGPIITIRKFSKDPYTSNDLISFGTLTWEMAQLLEEIGRAHV